LRKAVQLTVRLLDSVAVLALLVMMMVTTSDVILRKVANKPITGTPELVELALGVAFFFAAPGVFARGANIAVDMIDQWRPQWSKALKRLSAVLAVVTLGLFTWHMWKPMMDIITFGDTSADLQIPKIWFMAPAWFGILISLVVAIYVLLAGEAEAPATASTEGLPRGTLT
jgi:TRAP-type transport system small permease protein